MIEIDAPHFDHKDDVTKLFIGNIVASAVEAVADVVHDINAGGPGSGRHKENWVFKGRHDNWSKESYNRLYTHTTLPIKSIVGYEFHQSRNKIKDIVEKLKSGKPMPVITVTRSVDHYRIVDGHHRLAAAKRLGLTDLPVRVERTGMELMKYDEAHPNVDYTKNKNLDAAKETLYPDDHKAGMRVPKGGSSCASCVYLEDGNKCNNKYFIKWNGSNELPAPADEYCSDWYEPKKDIEAGGPGSGRHKQSGEILYHGTVKSKLAQITKEGLKLQKSGGQVIPHVTSNKDEAIKFAQSQGSNKDHPIVIALKPEASKFFDSGELGEGFGKSSYRESTRSNIPAKYIGEVTIHKIEAGSETSLAGIQKGSIWNGIRIIGFNGPQEEGLRAMLSRIPPEMLFNVKQIESAKELNAKHGRFIPETKTVLFNPVNFILRQRFGRGDGWMYHAETTVCHEVGHSVYEALTPEKKREWQRLSGWRIGWKEGQSVPYTELRKGWEKTTSKWTHRVGIKFPRHYSERNPNEDFADCFSFFILNKAHQMEKTKRAWLEQLFKDNVKSYSQVSIQSPTKPYGTRKR